MRKNLWIISDVFIAGIFLFLVFSYLHKSNIDNLNDYNTKKYLKEYLNFYNSKQFDKAIETAKKLNNFAIANNNDTLIAYSYDKIGDVYDKIENNDTALYYHQLAFNYWIKSGNKKFWSISYNQLGLNYLRKGDYHNAIDNFLKAVEYKDYYPFDRSYLYLMNLGCAYYQQGDYKEAINVFGESIKKYPPERLKDLSYVNTLVNIALSYIGIDDFNNSYKYLNKAYQIALENNYNFSQGYILQSKAHYFFKKNLIDSSEYYYLKSLDIFKKTRTFAIANEVKLRLARIYLETNRLHYAKTLLDSTYYFFNKHFYNKSFLCENYRLYALLYLNSGDLKKALAYSDSALSIAEQNNSLTLLKDIYYVRYQIFQKSNSLQNAIDALLKYNNIYQKIFNQVNTNYIYGVERSLEIHKKSNELEKSYLDKELITHNLYFAYLIISFIIVVLVLSIFLIIKLKKSRKKIGEQKIIVEQQNLQLSNQNDELIKQYKIAEELNELKEMIIRIIGHDLRNPISLSYSYAELLNQKYNDPYLNQRLNYISVSAINAIELLENLIDWSKMQSNDSKGEFALVYPKKIVQEIIDYYKPFIISKNIEIINNIIDNAIYSNANYLKTIVRNVLSNALKYAPENSKVSINSYIDANKLCLQIIDEGAGISDEVIEKIYKNEKINSSNGTKGETGLGMGYELIKYFLKKLNGEVIFNKVEKGTSIGLLFPLLEPK